MLDYNQIKDLIKEIDSSSLRVFELEDSDIKLKLSKNDENKPTNDLINDVSLSEPSLQSSNKTTFELNTTEVNDEATTLDENITIINIRILLRNIIFKIILRFFVTNHKEIFINSNLWRRQSHSWT